MKPEVAILALENLKAGAEANPMALYPEGSRVAWRSKVMSVLTRAQSDQISAFSAIRYGLPFDGSPEAEARAFRGGLSEAIGLIDGAIFELNLSVEDDGELLEGDLFDPELWEHVKGLVDNKDWGKVTSQVSIFVESHIRTWTGNPKSKTEGDLVGKNLFAKVLGDSSEYQLGNQPGEREGWLMLGMGFAQALGNVDRHHIMKRKDAKPYAIGVLGIGSLLLTQLRYEHGKTLKNIPRV